MATFEEEFERLKPVVQRLTKYALFGKKVKIKGEENFVKNGPNIIIGNHIGSFKDVATLLKIVPRPIFFTANKDIFSKEEFNALITVHFRRHLKNFSLFMEIIFSPFRAFFVNFISTNISKVGTIPVDLVNRNIMAIRRFQEYLKEGRAIIALQGKGRVVVKDPHPYVSPFRKGTSIIAYKLYKNGITVPVTPIAFFGTHFPYIVPKNIRVNVGRPMYISDYINGGREKTVEEFRSALETKVKQLFQEIIKSENSKKTKE